MGSVVERMVHETKEESLQQQRRDPLDDFRRCIDAVNNRHAPNVVSLAESRIDRQQSTYPPDAFFFFFLLCCCSVF